jgi:Ca2+-binding EF-hand superfamily protein
MSRRSALAWVAAAMLVLSAERASAADPPSESPADRMPALKKIPPGSPVDPKALFRIIDGNENGVIDRGEWRERKMAVFYIHDANQDLQLSRNESPGIGADAFAAADVDKDGFLSGYEFNQASFTQFERADANSDGSLSVDEFSVFLRQLKE